MSGERLQDHWPSAPAWGYIHMVKHEKNVYKSDFKANFVKSDKGFVLTSKGVVCPSHGAMKSLKMCINSFFKLATNGQSDKGFLLTSKVCPQGGCNPLVLGLYTCIKSLKVCIKSDSKRSFWNLQHMGKNKWHMLSSKFCPQCVVWPCPGLYTCDKTWKNVYKIRLQRDCFKTCNKWAKW